MTEISYCVDQVRRYDYDRFLTLVFAPASARESLAALYAFNLEIAKTREIVSEPLVGQMRLQWWRDTLDRLYAGETIAHEVARPLGQAILAAKLDRAFFDSLIDAREQDLDDTPPPDLAALEAYADGTSSPLLRLAFQMLGLSDGGAEAAGSIGRAWALTGLIRAIPFHARQRRLYLPQDRLNAHGVNIGRLFDFKSDPALHSAVGEVGTRALALLREGRAARGTVSRPARSPLLLAALADSYLGDLRRAGWDPFAAAARRERPLAILRLAGLSAVARY